MKKRRKSLIQELKWTVLGLSAAMLVMWFLFYVNIHKLIQSYVMQNMEQVSEQIISEMNRSFLRLEEVSFSLSQDEGVKRFVQEKGYVDYVEQAAGIAETIGRFSEDSSFMDNLIIYNEQRRAYRFIGNISNTAIQRLMNVTVREEVGSHIQIHLDETDYIGYVTAIHQEKKRIGTIVMLTDENEIYHLFEQMAKNDKIKIALAAEGQVILTNEKKFEESQVSDLRREHTYIVYEKVGFTPFELLISYEGSNYSMSTLFLCAMLVMGVSLFLLLEVFLLFWKRKFFEPIQSVISQVEGLEGGIGASIQPTGMEHFDGLVSGINEMVSRIEQKEKEVYETAYSLQEVEIKKHKALIISLKKQISAHFTVNVLNIIKALSSLGENEKAGQMCDGLSFLLRYANAGDEFIGGMEEFFVLERYTDIMEIRYPGKFTVQIDMEDALEEIEVPRMLLQPIVENSLLHGIVKEESNEIQRVHVYCEIEDDYISIIIEDNGIGMSSEQLAKLRDDIRDANQNEVEVEGLSHIALINIERRIHSYFGEEYGLTIESVENVGTKVTVMIPIRRRLTEMG